MEDNWKPPKSFFSQAGDIVLKKGGGHNFFKFDPQVFFFRFQEKGKYKPGQDSAPSGTGELRGTPTGV